MEDQSSWQIMSTNYDRNAYYVSRDDQNQNAAISNQLGSGLPLSQWLHPSRIPRSYVELLNEDSTYLEYTMESINSHASSHSAANGNGAKQKEPEYKSGGSGEAYGLKSYSSAINLSAWKSKASVHVQSRNSPETSESTDKRPAVGKSSDKLMHPQSETNAKQKIICGAQKRTVDNQDSFRFSPQGRAGPTKRSNVSRCKANASERERNSRIAHDIKALKELLPNPVEDTPESILNDVIAHVKLLQLQMKELSRSRLGGEPTSHPFIFIEGYGHYIHHEQMTKEPLEEMMAKLLETDPSAAISLLEKKGLYLMPMALADKFCRNSP